MSRRRWLRRAPLLATPALLRAQDNASGAGIRVFNIVDFGARPDRDTLSTKALQAAIDACHKDRGGVVLVPAGTFVTGTVELRSNVTLRLSAGANLIGSADGKQYYAAERIPLRGDSTLGDGNVGLIFAVEAENVTVEGPGTIDGQGLQFRSPSRGVPPPSGRGGADRPYHLLFHRCRNLRVRDLNLVNCAFHSIRVIQSRFVWMERLRIENRVNNNNDGFHFISTENVHVAGCDVYCQDDACALFGSCRNITVSDSVFSTRWSVFRFGGGNPENVLVNNCVIHQTYGCPIKLHFCGDQKARNLVFSNLVMDDVTGPIGVHISERSQVRDLRFQNIRATVVGQGRQYDDMAFQQNYRSGETRQCIVLNALGDAVLEDISINDVRVTYAGGGTREEASRAVPEVAGEYFEIGTPPAYGLYARNVRRLSLNNVSMDVETADLRPAIVFERVEDSVLSGLAAAGSAGTEAVVRCQDTRNVLIRGARLTSAANLFLKTDGASSNIILEGGDLSRAKAIR